MAEPSSARKPHQRFFPATDGVRAAVDRAGAVVEPRSGARARIRGPMEIDMPRSTMSRMWNGPARAALACAAMMGALGGGACSNPDSGTNPDGGDGSGTAVGAIALSSTLESAAVSAPVDIVRDEWGIPHIYGASLADVAFAQGYAQAEDRLVQMDLLRRNAEGSLAELVGGLSESVVDGDIRMRMHHIRATSQAAFDALKASADPEDQRIVGALEAFALGVNAYAEALQRGDYSIPGAVAFLYDPKGFRAWNAVDSILLLNFETFYFNYSADAEIELTQLEAAAAAAFDKSVDPLRLARKGIYADFTIFAPIDPTYTIAGWTGMNGDTSRAALDLPPDDGNFLTLLGADRPTLKGVARPWLDASTAASNNWVVAPRHTANGHALVANDTHVPLQNPPIWHMAHVTARGAGDKAFNAMGESIPGVPAIVLGMNEHIAWGATTDQMDQSDVYSETIVTCDGGTNPCVMFNGKKVALVPRKESFGIGKYGKITRTVDVTFYDVPHHGPIIPRINAADHSLEALGQAELSVRYVGYEPTQLARAVGGLLYAKTVTEWAAAIDRDNKTAAFNWVVGDDQGNIGWTEVARVPRRAKGFAPWKVMPGDGTAEWGADMDPKYIPHAWNPDKGYLATANADPIGVTDDGEPFFSEPVVDGSPLYLTWDYVDGARAGRITKRLQGAIDAKQKLTLDDMQSIQADATTEWGQTLAPVLVDAVTKLVEEMKTPGTHPDLTAIVAGLDPSVKAQIEPALALVKGWSFDTPAAMAEDSPTAAQIADSQATLVFQRWLGAMVAATFNDELQALGMGVDNNHLMKLLARAALHPEKVVSGIAPETKDPRVFDDMRTVPVESKVQVASQAFATALAALDAKLGADMTKWRWGQVHTLTLDFLVPMAALKIPTASDAQYPNGFPRHGAIETVDPGGTLDSFTYAHGPGIRFVCELDPVKGPIARNALPGGEAFDPGSPHYRDQMELWRKNKTFDLAFRDEDVVKSAQKEYDTNKIGRIHVVPKK